MAEVRQFQQMLPGAVVANGAVDDVWRTAVSTGPGNLCYYATTELDLRALTAGNENGIQLANFTLQEAGPWFSTIAGDSGWFMVYDMVTTQRPH